MISVTDGQISVPLGGSQDMLPVYKYRTTYINLYMLFIIHICTNVMVWTDMVANSEIG